MVGNLEGWPVLTQDGGYLPDLPFPKKTSGPAFQPALLHYLLKTDAIPSCPYRPCQERTGL